MQLIKELEEDPVTFIIENNTSKKENGVVSAINQNPSPFDQLIELSNEKAALFERILELEKERNVLLKKFTKEKQ
jgi:hypothetical protein